MIAAVVLLAQIAVAALSENHRGWLENEVYHIITDEEQDFFRTLATSEERDRFIDSFWDRRDPDRLTPRNEYRDEHYRRFELANQKFGRSSSLPGSRTERGQVFVLLGEPSRFQPIVGSNEVVDSEIWYYYNQRLPGLPSRLSLVFFKKNNFGDYELYSPVDDGPELLLNSGSFFRENRRARATPPGGSTLRGTHLRWPVALARGAPGHGKSALPPPSASSCNSTP